MSNKSSSLDLSQCRVFALRRFNVAISVKLWAQRGLIDESTVNHLLTLNLSAVHVSLMIGELQ